VDVHHRTQLQKRNKLATLFAALAVFIDRHKSFQVFVSQESSKKMAEPAAQAAAPPQQVTVPLPPAPAVGAMLPAFIMAPQEGARVIANMVACTDKVWTDFVESHSRI
jgi:hypothetical protein